MSCWSSYVKWERRWLITQRLELNWQHPNYATTLSDHTHTGAIAIWFLYRVRLTAINLSWIVEFRLKFQMAAIWFCYCRNSGKLPGKNSLVQRNKWIKMPLFLLLLLWQNGCYYFHDSTSLCCPIATSITTSRLSHSSTELHYTLSVISVIFCALQL